MEQKSPEEMEQESSLDLYKSQLSQVDQALQAAGASEDLTTLKSDLEELIKLTQDNLLEIKKAKLLKMLGPSAVDDDSDEEKVEVSDKGGNADEEYAAFQMAIAEYPNPPIESKVNEPRNFDNGTTSTASYSESSGVVDQQQRHVADDDCVVDGDRDDSLAEAQSKLLEMVGTKCRAPFSQEWGDHHYGNAMILSVDDPANAETAEDYVVHVIFINPIHQSMVPCQFFMEGQCRFSAEDCRSSHGYPVSVSHLQPYLEPEYSNLVEGCRCLAKRRGDSVWFQGVVVDVCSDTELRVRFDATKEEDLVLVEHTIPLDNDDSDSDSDSSGDELSYRQRIKKTSLDSDDDDDGESEVPVYLWKPLKTTDKLGAWEAHTKGIGSKLMAKMGYIHGQGLGRHGEGRAEPVPILLLPQGKSLDKIMELKEMAGNADLFNAMKKLEKRQKAMEKKEADSARQKKGPTNWGVFGFLNQHLGKGKDGHGQGCSSLDPKSSSLSSSAPLTPSSASSSSSSLSSTVVDQAKQSCEKDLTKRSDKEVNVQIFKTAEAIRGVERTLSHLRRQLARNENRDRKMTDTIRQKIELEESNLRRLKSSSQTLESHKERRKAHKKLTIF